MKTQENLSTFADDAESSVAATAEQVHKSRRRRDLLRPLMAIGLVAMLLPFLWLPNPAAERNVADSRSRLEPVSEPMAANNLVTAEPNAAGQRAPLEAPRPLPPMIDPDSALREKLLGTWKQNNTGVRWLSIRPDGKVTMIIEPDWKAILIIGSRLVMEVEWTVKDGRALMRSVSGKPESAFNAATSLFGRDRNRLIQFPNDSTFVMIDEEDGSRSEWTRPKPGEKLPPEFKRP